VKPQYSLPRQKLIEFPNKIVICYAYQHQADAIKDWSRSTKVSKGHQPVPGLPQDDLPKEYHPELQKTS